MQTEYKNIYLFKNIDSETNAYWFGFLHADGCLCKNHIEVELAIKDKEHLKKFSNLFNSKLKARQRYLKETGKYYKSIRCKIYNKTIADLLRNNGLKSKKLLIDSLPANLRHHFIRGYMDGDGTIYMTKGGIGLGFVGGYGLLSNIRKILRKEISGLGNVKISKDRNIYKLYWGGNKQVKNIYEYLYKDATICLERKRKIAEKLYGR